MHRANRLYVTVPGCGGAQKLYTQVVVGEWRWLCMWLCVRVCGSVAVAMGCRRGCHTRHCSAAGPHTPRPGGAEEWVKARRCSHSAGRGTFVHTVPLGVTVCGVVVGCVCLRVWLRVVSVSPVPCLAQKPGTLRSSGGGLAALTGGRSLISGDVALLVNKAFESVEVERKAVHGGAGVKATCTI